MRLLMVRVVIVYQLFGFSGILLAATKLLTVEEVEELLQEGVTPKRVVTLIEEHGVAFEMIESLQERLRKAGADDRVLNAIKRARLVYSQKKRNAGPQQLEEMKSETQEDYSPEHTDYPSRTEEHWAGSGEERTEELGDFLMKAITATGIDELADSQKTISVLHSPSGGESNDDNLSTFLDHFIRHGNRCNLDTLLSLYDEYVDYYEKGDVNKNFIQKDKENYCKRWSKIDNTLIGKTKAIDFAENVKVIVYDIHYQVFSSSRKEGISGTARNALAIERALRGWKVIGEKQRVLNRERLSSLNETAS